MPARTPEEAVQLVHQCLNEGKLDELLALYEPTATFVPQPGTVVSGTNQIREAARPFLALKPKLTAKSMHKLLAGDIAIIYMKWSLTGTGPDGTPLSMEGLSTHVVRRQRDGTWKFAVHNPWGTAVLA